MNIEQERKDFEAWYEKEFPYEPIPIRAAEGYFHRYDNKLWNAYQAGRAAMQSQDREDAERYRWLRDLPEGSPHEEIGNLPGDMWDAAIDHARRAEGGGK